MQNMIFIPPSGRYSLFCGLATIFINGAVQCAVSKVLCDGRHRCQAELALRHRLRIFLTSSPLFNEGTFTCMRYSPVPLL